MKILSIALVMLFCTCVQAQDKMNNKCKIKFQSDLQMGVLAGKIGNNFQLQSVNGIRINTFSLGLGAGIDFYGGRSIPVFLDIKKDLFDKRETPFLYFSGGRHFPWQVEQKGFTYSDQKSGWFYDAGIGYTIPLKKQSILFSAGYSFKSFDEVVTSDDIICITWPCIPFSESFSYKLRRISLRAGIRF